MEKNKSYTFYIIEEVKCDIDFEELYRLLKMEYGEDIDNKTARERFGDDMSYYILQLTSEDIDIYEPVNDYHARDLYLDFDEWLEENHKEDENI